MSVSRPAILVWRLGALGDTVLLLPALAALRAAFPEHEIVAAGRPAAFAPALWSGLAGRVLDAADARLAALFMGSAPPPGALPADLDMAIVWSASHPDIARGLRRAGARRIVAAPALPPERRPVAAHYLATVQQLGAMPVPFTLEAPASALETTASSWRHATDGADAPVALLHPGAGSVLKRWPLERYLRLAQALRSDGMAVVWTSGPADHDVRGALEATPEHVHLLPAVDEAGLAALLSRAAVVVSGDCGVAHLAALLAVPTVTMFGPTDHVLWGPPGDHGAVVRLALPCSPCGEVARNCPSRICLRGLPESSVRAAVHSLVAMAARGAVGSDGANGGRPPYPVPSRQTVCHPPAPAPGPPGFLQLARWDRGHTWGAQLFPETE